MHEEYGIPGHVEVVVGQMGEIRNIGNSSFNGYRHMNGTELRDLLSRGWGVGNHSWSHEVITPEMVGREIGHAKSVLEEALGEAIILYCSPGDNTNMAGHVLEACRRHNYLGAMSLTDALKPARGRTVLDQPHRPARPLLPALLQRLRPVPEYPAGPGIPGLDHRLLPLPAGDGRPSQQGLLRSPAAAAY